MDALTVSLTLMADSASAISTVRDYVAPLMQALVGIASLASVFFIVYGGFLYMTSKGSPEKLEGAKRVLRNALIGLVIVLGAATLTALLSGAVSHDTSPTNASLPNLEAIEPEESGGGLIEILINAITGLLNLIIQTVATPFLSALDFFTKATPLMSENSAVFNLWLANKRLPAVLRKNSLILSSSEIASFYHFPSSRISRTDNLITSLSRTLPAPVSLKREQRFDVVIGENVHHDTITPIGLTQAERDRHMYIIGGTGNGKTTMIKYAAIQDLRNNKGMALVDPHGDLAEELLEYVPSERVNDVVYFNPDDLEHPFAMNLLELSPDLEGNDLLREKDIITESVVSIFRKIFSDDDSGGHRIEYVLRNAIHTALTVEDATIFTVLKLLQSATYRRSVVNKLEDEDLKDFWKSEMGMQKVKMSAGITAKIGRFNVNAAAKSILGQEKSTIDFEQR